LKANEDAKKKEKEKKDSKKDDSALTDIETYSDSESPGVKVIIALYVDDLMLTSNSSDLLSKVKVALKQNYKMTDLGELSWCLRIQVAQCQDSVRLTQGTFILKMFESTTRAGKGGRSGNSTNAQKKPKSSASRSSASSISLLLGMKPTWHICQKSKTFDSTAQTNHWS
jgi:hypothetical protein